MEINKVEIRIIEKPEYITYEQIQECLSKAHEANIKRGLVYATKEQTVEKLIEKLKDSITYVALTPDNIVVATASVQIRKLNYWYHRGDIGLIKLVGVLPEYSGKKLASKLLTLSCNWVKERISSSGGIIVSDSAEENIAMRNLFLHNGFKMVDCCKYPNNNFISSVYAFWFNGCTFSDDEIKKRYFEHREKLI